EEYLMEEQRVARHARQLFVIVSHDFDADRTVCRRPQRQYLLQDDVQAHRPAHETAGSREDEQVPYDLRRAIRFTINRADLAAQLFGKRSCRPQELEVAEDALQRVVQLVRDAGDELAERRQLFALRQALPQLLAFRLEPRLRGQIARDDDAANRLAI